MITYEGSFKDRTTAFSEAAIIALDQDWAGVIDYQLMVKSAAVGTIGVIFRWTDRRGVAASHTVTGLSLLATGVVADNQFRLWTRNQSAQNVTLEVTLTGIIGTPSFDFFFMASGNSFG